MSISGGLHDAGQEVEALPIGKIARIAMKGIRIRLWRSLLVVSCIVLAVAFLTYILGADTFQRNLPRAGSEELVEKLAEAAPIASHFEQHMLTLSGSNSNCLTDIGFGIATMVEMQHFAVGRRRSTGAGATDRSRIRRAFEVAFIQHDNAVVLRGHLCDGQQ